VWLHCLRILGLSQNLKELVVGQEVEAREGNTFGLQVLFKALLDVFKR
jgi:hypothetical protein